MKTRKEEIEAQVNLSKKVKRDFGWVAIITSTLVGKKEHFGFRFEKEEKAIIGTVVDNMDGSISKIEAVA